MKKRRIVFNIGVTYNTPKTKLEKIPAMIKEILKKQKNIETERVHFKEFGDSALIFEVVFFVKSGDYKIYLDTQQVINLEIVKEFEKQQIEMAFPTQTLYLKK